MYKKFNIKKTNYFVTIVILDCVTSTSGNLVQINCCKVYLKRSLTKFETYMSLVNSLINTYSLKCKMFSQFSKHFILNVSSN